MPLNSVFLDYLFLYIYNTIYKYFSQYYLAFVGKPLEFTKGDSANAK